MYVVDGDTVDVRFDDGRSERVRLIGVDTPESTREQEPYGEEASAYTKKVLQGRTVWAETDSELRDRYGRLLAYVWLEAPAGKGEAEVRSAMFNARLLLDGYAQQMTIPPNTRYAEMFTVFVRDARDAGRGLWGGGAESGAGTGEAVEGAYVGNRRSKKFHRPGCPSVDDMSPANKVSLPDRDGAVDDGYVPCKVCEP